MKMSLPRLALKHPITVIMLTISLVGLGVISCTRLPLTFLPSMDFPFLTVMIPYAGATPEQVEKEIAIPAEGEFGTVPQVRRISTTSDTGGCRVGMQFESNTDMSVASAEVRDRIERLKLVLPHEVERVMIYRHSSNSMPVMALGLFRAGEERDTSHLIRTVIQPRLARLDGVAEVRVHTSKPEDEVLIEFDQDQLRSHNVGLFNLVNMLESANINFPAGELTEGTTKYYLRVADEFRRPEDIGDIVIGPNALRISDVAEVSFRSRDPEGRYDVDDKGGAFVIISKESEANTVDVCQAIKDELERLKADPEMAGFDQLVFFDQSKMILSALNGLIDAGQTGAILATLVLFLFLLRLAPTLVVALSMPISLIGAFVFMFFSGMTLNVITMMSLIVAVGMLVDDAIVVLENIYRYYQHGLDSVEAACRGAEEVGVAITAATLTTAVVFVPVLYMEGGQMPVFMKQFAWPMTMALAGSLLTALTIIPLVLSRMRKPKTRLYLFKTGDAAEPDAKTNWLALLKTHPLNAVIEVYARVLRLVMRKRVESAALVILVLTMTVAVPMQKVGMKQMAELDMREVNLKIEFDQTLTSDMADQIFGEIKSAVNLQRDELGIRNVFAMSTASGGSIDLYLNTKEDLEKDPAKTMPYTTQEVIDILTARLPKRIPGCRINLWLPHGGQEGGSANSLSLRLRGDDSKLLSEYSQRLKELVAALPDIQEVTVNTETQRQEYQLQIDEARAQQAGVTPLVVARTVDMALRGNRLPNLKQAGREYRVWAQFREEDRKNRDNLDNVATMGEKGGLVPLSQLVNYTKADSPSAVERIDGKNVLSLTIKTDAKDLTGVRKKLDQLIDNFQLPLGYSVDHGDELVELEMNQSNYITTLFLALILVYIVMSALFESVFLPISILVTVPLAFVGVYWTLYMTATPLDTVGLIGCVLMVGVIVKNGIVIVDHINFLRNEGQSRLDAIVQAGRDRFRPVIMTALTTILGCVPIALSTNTESAVSYVSLGRAFIGGLVGGTMLTLVVVPLLYTLIDDVQEWSKDYLASLFSIGKQSA